MNRLLYIIIGVMAVLLGACKPGTPKQYIQPDDMEDILVDYHIAMALAQENGDNSLTRQRYLESVLAKHNVSRADFDSSLVYYYIRADRFKKMYTRVNDRLDEKALGLGATEGEIGKYSSLAATGDTANIWQEQDRQFLLPVAPYNRYEFAIDADSTFLPGDKLLLQFMADFVYQDGMKNGYVYLAAEYADTVLTVQRNYTYSGLIQARLEGLPDQAIKHIRGYFYLGGANEQTSTLRLMFINNLQLIRFHAKQPEKPAQLPADSVANTDNTGSEKTDTAGSRTMLRDSIGLLPAGKRVDKNRVVELSSPTEVQSGR